MSGFLLWALDQETYKSRREKENFVLKSVRVAVIEKLKLNDFNATLSDDVLKQISSTTKDLNGVLLEENPSLKDELKVIAQWVIDEVLRIEQGIADGTMKTKNIHDIKPTSYNPPDIAALIGNVRM